MRSFAPSKIVLLLAALCAAAAEARPDAVPQITNNAPFSGAVYLVNPNGEQVTAQGTNYCPSSASQSCSSVNAPSWCCPANYACVVPSNSNGLLGCCPSGSTCGGSVNAAQINTVTVQAQQYTTYVQPNPTVVVYNAPNTVQGGFCATITMTGPGLPRAAEGQCGTILLVAEGTPSLKMIGAGVGLVVTLLHVALGRMHR
ncbi:hypothetical protein EKO04_001445 [Ascochyta lentis]|uniref:Uncharacterized protein n=1 Tax=Ascochyta lentis TaxID=205686 RepID=A0A8H7JCP8_9PLEO|nr:hypothetical protein EKO04_001445 [Ascochyta lentis]